MKMKWLTRLSVIAVFVLILLAICPNPTRAAAYLPCVRGGGQNL